MSYSPTTWQTNDVISSTKLNKIEQGIADISNLVLTETATEVSGGTCYTLNASPSLIKEALSKGKRIWILRENNSFISAGSFYDEGENYQLQDPNSLSLYYEASNFYSPFYYIIVTPPEPN